MSDCLFCKFVSGEFATTKVFENDDFIIIRDINPQAVNHFLAIPKKHYKLLADMAEEDSLTNANFENITDLTIRLSQTQSSSYYNSLMLKKSF